MELLSMALLPMFALVILALRWLKELVDREPPCPDCELLGGECQECQVDRSAW